jgi:hypothetical protein
MKFIQNILDMSTKCLTFIAFKNLKKPITTKK